MSDTIDTRNHPTVKALEQHRVRLGLKDGQFAARLRVSPASWSTMRDGTYGAENKEPMLERFEAALRQFEDQAEAGAHAGTAEILDLTHVRAALKAVRLSAREPRNRLVVFLAHTGGGKTTLATKLSATYLDSCVCVEATETWRDSYFAALLAVAHALGCDSGLGNARAAETAVLDALAVSPRILVVDEAHHGGRAALNLLKLVLNRCPETRVVALAIPPLWDRMQQANAPEAAQLRSRTCAKIVVPEVGAGDARAFLAARMPGYEALNGEEKEAIAEVCLAANRFGLFDTLERICREVVAEAGNRPATLALVRAAIKRAEALRS